jgi:hypothetical protein
LPDEIKTTITEGNKLLYKPLLTGSEMKLKEDRVKIVRKVSTLCGRLEFETYRGESPAESAPAPNVSIAENAESGSLNTTINDGTKALNSPDGTSATLSSGSSSTLKRKLNEDDAEGDLLQKAIYFGRKSDEYFDKYFGVALRIHIHNTKGR